MKSFTKIFALGAVLTASTTFASATPITPGSSVTGSTIIPVESGPVLASTSGTLTFAAAPTFTASYTESVFVDSSDTLAGCSGNCLTFEITVTNNGPDQLEHVTTGDGPGSGFAEFLANVGYAPGAGDTPTTINETSSTVSFNFANLINPGASTDPLIIQTNATNFSDGLVSAIDSSTGTNLGYIPAAATPEPNSLVLLGTGLMGAAGLLFARRRNTASIL